MKSNLPNNKMRLPNGENKMMDQPSDNKKKLKKTEARLEFTLDRLREITRAADLAIKEKNRFNHILDVYFPVITHIGEVQAWYNGRDDGVAKIYPNVTGELIKRLIKARKIYNIVPARKVKPVIIGG